MDRQFSDAARWSAGLVAFIAAGSLVAQSIGNMERDGSLLAGWSMMLRYFTIWGNLAAGVVFAWIAWRGSVEPRVPFALAAALVIIAAVYHLLLASQHHPQGVDWWTNIAHHTIVPAAGVLWWLFYSRDELTGWRSLPIVTLVPLIYGAFALILGAATGFYPYFFLDLPSLGLAQVLINMVGLAIVFMAVASGLLGLRKAIRVLA